MRDELNKRLKPVCRRLKLRAMLRRVPQGIAVGAWLGIVLALVRTYSTSLAPFWLIAIALAIVPLLAAARTLIGKDDWHGAARAIDDCYDLKDRAVTALAILQTGATKPMQAIQVRDALAHLERIAPRAVVAIAWPPRLLPALVLIAVAIGLAVWPIPLGHSTGPDASELEHTDRKASHPESVRLKPEDISTELAAASRQAYRRVDPLAATDEPLQPSNLGDRAIVRRYFELAEPQLRPERANQRAEQADSPRR